MPNLSELYPFPEAGDPILVIGHRGARGVKPENTLEAFAHARNIRAHGVELDVRLCASGEVVVFHDDKLDALTDGTGLVAEMPLEQLRKLKVRQPRPKDAPEGFRPALSGETIPTLAEVIETLGPELIIDIELKGRNWRPDGLEQKTLEAVRCMGAEKRVFYTSFNPVRLLRLRRLGRSLPLGMLFYHGNPRWIRNLWALPLVQPDLLAPFHEDIDGKLVEKARRRDLLLWTWTVNRQEDAERCAAAGVRAIITDFPEKMLALGLRS